MFNMHTMLLPGMGSIRSVEQLAAGWGKSVVLQLSARGGKIAGCGSFRSLQTSAYRNCRHATGKLLDPELFVVARLRAFNTRHAAVIVPEREAGSRTGIPLQGARLFCDSWR